MLRGSSDVLIVTKHEYACALARVVATKSTCPRAKVGAVFFSPDYEVLATGYNGAPRGLAHCEDKGCTMQDGHCVSSSHAELNAVTQAARRGTPLQGSILYCTHSPCNTCAKMLVNLGIKSVYYETAYWQGDRETLVKAGIFVASWNKDCVIKMLGIARPAFEGVKKE